MGAQPRMFLTAGLVAFAACSAHGGMIDLSGGWRASWDPSLDPYVDVFDVAVVVAQGVEVQVIQKSAEFVQPPPSPGFPFPTIPITFTQTRADAVRYIAIDDEIITNSTGIPWTDFHMVLLDGDDAHFDPVRTAGSGGGGPNGFSIEPFQSGSFTPNCKAFEVWEGVIPPGGHWYPGDGATDGQLWMELVTGNGDDKPFTTFILKETPTPSPGTWALLGAAALGVTRRKR